MWNMKKHQNRKKEINDSACTRSAGLTMGGVGNCVVRDPAPGASSVGSTLGDLRYIAKDQCSLDATADRGGRRYRFSFGSSLRRGGTSYKYSFAGTVIPYLKTVPLTALTAILSRSDSLLSIADWKQLTHLICPKRQESPGCQDLASRPRSRSTRSTPPARFTQRKSVV